MNCIVLAAGYATRLYPLTRNFPKPLLDVGGRTILDRLLDDVERSGKISRYVVVSNARFADQFRRWRDAKQNGSTRLSATVEILDDGSTTNETRIGAVKDILFAFETLNLSGDSFVLAGDNLPDFSLVSFFEYFERKNAIAPANVVMRYFEPSVEKLRKSGVLELDESDRVSAMEEKPAEPKSNWRCPPFYLYRSPTSAKIRAALDAGCGFDAPGSLVAALCRQEPFFAMKAPGRFFDVGNLESYEKINALFKTE